MVVSSRMSLLSIPLSMRLAVYSAATPISPQEAQPDSLCQFTVAGQAIHLCPLFDGAIYSLKTTGSGSSAEEVIRLSLGQQRNECIEDVCYSGIDIHRTTSAAELDSQLTVDFRDVVLAGSPKHATITFICASAISEPSKPTYDYADDKAHHLTWQTSHACPFPSTATTDSFSGHSPTSAGLQDGSVSRDNAREDSGDAGDSSRTDSESDPDSSGSDLVPPTPSRRALTHILPPVLISFVLIILAAWAYARYPDACVAALVTAMGYAKGAWGKARRITGLGSRGRRGYEEIDVDLESEPASILPGPAVGRRGRRGKKGLAALTASLSNARKSTTNWLSRPGEARLLSWANEDFALGSYAEDDDADADDEDSDDALMVNGASFTDTRRGAGRMPVGRTRWEGEEVPLTPSPRTSTFSQSHSHTKSYGSVG